MASDVQTTPSEGVKGVKGLRAAKVSASVQGHHKSAIARLGERLTKTVTQLEADELREDAARLGCTPMCDLLDRQQATVSGTVRAVTLRPRVNVPALVIDLYDGSRTINLVWLGRRALAGIEPGTYLRAQGRVTYYRGIPTIFNPPYEIVPLRAH